MIYFLSRLLRVSRISSWLCVSKMRDCVGLVSSKFKVLKRDTRRGTTWGQFWPPNWVADSDLIICGALSMRGKATAVLHDH
jgi:hypothetical protein